MFWLSQQNTPTLDTVYYTGIKQWNALPSATQLLSNKQAFKSEVKNCYG